MPSHKYKYNPNVEIGKNGLGQPNSSIVDRSTIRAQFGTASAIVTMPGSATSGTVGVSFFQESPYHTLKPNTTYVASAYVYIPAATGALRIAVQGDGRTTENNAESYTSLKDQWVRIWNRFTTDDGGIVTAYVLNTNATTTPNTQFWADGFMVTEGTTPYAYADGNSPGWVWNGANGLSSSTGPRL